MQMNGLLPTWKLAGELVSITKVMSPPETE
jgi:hypothetical protein